jgi:hypothetical protein
MFDALTVALVTEACATYAVGAMPDFQNASKTCHVYHSKVNDVDCFAFEGTQSFNEWLVDFLAIGFEGYCHPVYGEVHLGFHCDIQEAVNWIVDVLDGLGNPPYYLCGHSKGAGEAILAHAQLKSINRPPLATRAYESPRVGKAALAAYLQQDDIQLTQTFNKFGSDLITLVPTEFNWLAVRLPLRLQVPDELTVAQKHLIPAVGLALGVPGLVG